MKCHDALDGVGDCSSIHSLTRIRGCLIIPEKAFSLDDLGGLYAVRVEMGHRFEGFFTSAKLSFLPQFAGGVLGAKSDIIPR